MSGLANFVAQTRPQMEKLLAVAKEQAAEFAKHPITGAINIVAFGTAPTGRRREFTKGLKGRLAERQKALKLKGVD